MTFLQNRNRSWTWKVDLDVLVGSGEKGGTDSGFWVHK